MQKHNIYLALTIYSVLGRLDKGSFLSESSIRNKKNVPNHLFTGMGGKFKFSAQHSDFAHFFESYRTFV